MPADRHLSQGQFRVVTSEVEGGGPEARGVFLDTGYGASDDGSYSWNEIVDTAQEWGRVLDQDPSRGELTVEVPDPDTGKPVREILRARRD